MNAVVSAAERALGEYNRSVQEARIKGLPAIRLPVSDVDSKLDRAGAVHGLANYRLIVRIEDQLTGRRRTCDETRIQLAEATEEARRDLSRCTRATGWDPDRIEAERRRLEGSLAELAAQEAQQSALASALSGCIAPLRRIDDAIVGFVRSHRPSELRPVDPPKVPKGATFATLHAAGDKLRAEAAALEIAPYDVDSVKASIRAEIKALARPPSVVRMFARTSDSSSIFFPSHQLAGAMVPDGVSLACWLHGDEIAERLCAEADRRAAEFPGGIDDAARAARLRELADAILANDRLEAVAGLALLRDGAEAALRADCNPRALLSLQ